MKKLVVLVSIAVLAATFSAARVIPAHAAFPGTNGRIVFQGCDDVTCHIYTVNPDGSALRQITNSSAFDITPDLSPDGSRIVYARNTFAPGARFHLRIVNADGSNDHQLTPVTSATGELWPRFMPGGMRIVFTQFRDDGGIYSIRTDGTHRRAIIPSPTNGLSYNEAVPSPKGKRLVFTLFGKHGILVGVYTSRIDGTHEKLITPPRLEAWNPDWGPHGKRVVFATNRARPNSAIYAVNSDGTDVDGLTHPPFPFNDSTPAFSPDGDRIVYVSDRGYPDFCCSNLFTMGHGGRGVQQIPLPPSIIWVYGPRWSTAPLLSGPSDPVAMNPGKSSVTRRTTLGIVCSGLPGSVESSLGVPCIRRP
jgi:Tol biopolymer transport system component